jgi:type VI secretion system Hcp family effector
MAFKGYATWTSTKTGFKPEPTSGASTFAQGHENQFPFLRMEGQLHVPYDVTHGGSKAKRVHHPIVLLKEWGATTPLHIGIAAGNELIKSVVLSFYMVGNDGQDKLMYTITLTNAHIVKIKHYTGNADAGDPSTASTSSNPGDHDTMELEEIHLTFEKIQHSHEIASTHVVDDYLAPGPA